MPENNRNVKRRVLRVSHAVFVKRVVTMVTIVLLAALLVFLVWVSVRTWLVVFAAALLAIFLRAIADWVGTRTRLSSVWALTVTIVALLALSVLAGWLLAPNAVQQFNELAERLPKDIEQLKHRLQGLAWFRYVAEKLPSGSDIAAGGGGVISKVAGFFSGGVEAVTGVVLFLFLGVYFAAAPQVYLSGILRLVPIAKRARVGEILGALGATLRYWLLGQLLSMVVVGVLIGVGLKLLGVPLALALGVLAGLFDFIPIVGPLISAVPAVLLAFLISPWHALYVVALYLVVNTVIESHLLVPLIHRYTVSLPPGLTVLALVLMGSIFGFLGVLLATPVAAAVLVLVKMIYVEDVLGDKALEKAPKERGTKASVGS